jgi:hypothetical protein
MSKKKVGGNRPTELDRDYNDASGYKELVENYNADQSIVNAVKCFESKGTNPPGCTIDALKSVSFKGIDFNPGILGPRGKPVFTNFVEDGGFPVQIPNGSLITIKPTVLNEEEVASGIDNFKLLLNDKNPYPDVYPDTLGPAGPNTKGSAGMSLVHFFGVPIERIYNAITLNKSHEDLLNKMKQRAITWMNIQANKVKVIEFVEKIVNNDVNRYNPSDADKILTRFQTDKMAFLDPTYNAGNDLEFCFHVHPFPSVAHLHMHCILKFFRTSDIHDWKNMPLDVVLTNLPLTGGKKEHSNS